jgi:hypothetical protein
MSREQMEKDVDLGSAWAMIGLAMRLKREGKLNTPEGDAAIEQFGSVMPLFNGQRERDAEAREQKRLDKLAEREARLNAEPKMQSNLPKKVKEKMLREWRKEQAQKVQKTLFAV